MNPQIVGPGTLFSSAWKLYKAHWKIFVLITILPSVGSYVGQLFTFLHSEALTIIGVLISIAAGVFSIAMAPALINAIHRFSTEPGAALTIKGQYKIGFSFFWSILLVGIINGFVVLGSAFLLIVPAIIVGVYACSYSYTLVVDGKKGFSSLTESYSLVRGRWAAVFGRLVVLGLLSALAWLILLGLAFVLASIFGLSGHGLVVSQGVDHVVSAGQLVIGFIVNLLEIGIIVPLVLTYMYNLYSSLKATRQAEVQTGTFKKWLVAFIIIGIFGIPIFGIMASVVLVSLNHARMQSQSPSDMPTQAQMEALMQQYQASSTPNGPTSY